MKLIIVVGWRSRNWKTEKHVLIYSGTCGVEAAKAAEAARKSGKFAEGFIKRKMITDWVPMACAPDVVANVKTA